MRLRARRSSLLLALIPALTVIVVMYVYPLGRLVIDSFVQHGEPTLARYADLLNDGVFASIVRRTLEVAAAVTIITIVLGYPFAYVINRLPTRWAVLLLLAVTVPFFTSTLIRSYAWVALLGNNGVLNGLFLGQGWITEPLRLVYSEVGVLIGMSQIQLPLMTLTLYSVMRRIDRSLLNAARSLGASPASAFWHVFRPLSLPGVASGASLVFVSSLGFYVTPALLGGPGDYFVAQSIDARISSAIDFGAAAAQSTILLGSVLGLMVLLRRPLGLALEDRMSERHSGVRRRPIGFAIAPLNWLMTEFLQRAGTVIGRSTLWLISAAALIYLLAPMTIVSMLAFSSGEFLALPLPGVSLRWFQSYVMDPAWVEATLFSTAVAAAAALAATALGTLAAFPLTRLSRLGTVHLVLISPLIVPHMVVAVALFFMLAPLGLIGSPLSFIAAYTVLGLPYVVVVMTAVLRRFDRSLEQAAASLGATPPRILLSVTLPLLRPGMLTALLFAFLIAFDDVVIALFLSSAEAVTLPIRIWQDVRFEISPKIAAVAVLFFAVTAISVILGRWRALRARGMIAP